MNLRPPPDNNDPDELRQWMNELYEYLKYPVFEVIRFKPISTAPATSEGNVYYDSDTNKLICRDDSAWNDLF